jgi:DNA-binding NarL/FixJ family response regulator
MAQRLKILIAEDDPLNAMALQAQVEAMGHTVVAVASNGEEAIDCARSREVDLALMDVRMPRVSGLDAARTIYNELSVPAVMLSGLHDDSTIQEAWSIPVFHYLVKPVPMDELGAAIQLAWRRFQESMHPSAANQSGSTG